MAYEPPPPQDPVTLDQQLACVRRELALRKNVYPKWVKASRMTQISADNEINHLQAVHDTLVMCKGIAPAAGVAPREIDPAHRIVPIEPTEEMLLAGCKAGLATVTLLDDTCFACERACWEAMIGAAT